jgi:hypothetical protein
LIKAFVVACLVVLVVTGCSPAPTEERLVGKWHGSGPFEEAGISGDSFVGLEFRSDRTYSQQVRIEFLVDGEATDLEFAELGEWSLTPSTRMIRMSTTSADLKSVTQTIQTKLAMVAVEGYCKMLVGMTYVYEVVDISEDRITFRDMDNSSRPALILVRD